MRIFLTGGSGFVGREICRQLDALEHEIHCLVRQDSENHLLPLPRVKPVQVDLFSPALADKIEACDAVIHLVGIIREFPHRQISFERLHCQATQAIVTATRAAGVKRYLHMSANGARDNAVTNYHKTKWRAEETVRQSDLDWTIFRPSLIYGAEDQFIRMLTDLIRKFPLLPVMGNGQYRLQPVPVQQVAAGFCRALEAEAAIRKTYHCGGADCLSYNQLLDLVATSIGKKPPFKVRQPLLLMKPLVSVMQHFPNFPITRDQLQMLLEGNCCDPDDWLRDLALDPVPLRTGLAYLQPA